MLNKNMTRKDVVDNNRNSDNGNESNHNNDSTLSRRKEAFLKNLKHVQNHKVNNNLKTQSSRQFLPNKHSAPKNSRLAARLQLIKHNSMMIHNDDDSDNESDNDENEDRHRISGIGELKNFKINDGGGSIYRKTRNVEKRRASQSLDLAISNKLQTKLHESKKAKKKKNSKELKKLPYRRIGSMETLIQEKRKRNIRDDHNSQTKYH